MNADAYGYGKMLTALSGVVDPDWNEISAFLDDCAVENPLTSNLSEGVFYSELGKGAAFITYDYGIDGVSIEITKYADCLAAIFKKRGIKLPLHFIGGDFHDKADIVLKPEWHRFRVEGFNGWSKWFGGEPFAMLFGEDMPAGSAASRAAAMEMWRQAADFAAKLGGYLAANDIRFIVPVNIPSNPGNFAAMLAIIIVSESLGLRVLSSNHDFYWEGGKPPAERRPDEDPGPRDHFFRNQANRPFFDLFKRMYPWNGRGWIQVNINSPQSKALVERFGFDSNRVFELGTSISDRFFERYSDDDVADARRRMAYILSGGSPMIETLGIAEHLTAIESWMSNQTPVVCARRGGIKLDLARPETIYCLQPTRVIARKRIEEDVELLAALSRHEPFRSVFENDVRRQIILHITGPVPVEHREDLELVLTAFKALCESLPTRVAERLFLAFSVGNEDHPGLRAAGLESLCIEEIYRLATVILFPSETEGRGLPIIESAASGVPIICSRYYPVKVFDEVVGEGLPDEEHIEYVLFPEHEDGFSKSFLDKVTKLLLKPDMFGEMINHNRIAARGRYGAVMVRERFELFLKALNEV